MSRTTHRLTVVVGLAAALALSMPALAGAQSLGTGHSTRIGADNVAGSGTRHVAVRPSQTAHQSVRVDPHASVAFPSSTSTVVGSTGFIDGEQVGYFWSVSRGDSVTESFAGPKKITKATFKLDVVTNALSEGNQVVWAASINGKILGDRFTVLPGQTGPLTVKYKFPKITGGNYTVKIWVTNEVPSGGGSMTLRYAGSGPHSVAFKK